jgi:hypothetical protein
VLQGSTFGGVPVVGLAQGITLSKRVQLAVLAHIRHNYTRYDELLREANYTAARKTVQPLCLDYIVKWRGDEETGRDQLDEILREVIVISDTESEEEGEVKEGDADTDEHSSGEEAPSAPVPAPVPGLMRLPHELSPEPPKADERPRLAPPPGTHVRVRSTDSVQILDPKRPRKKKARRKAKKAQRGFQRYQDVRNRAWHDAIERRRHGDEPTSTSQGQPLARVAGPADYVYGQTAAEVGFSGLDLHRGTPQTAFRIRRSPGRDHHPDVRPAVPLHQTLSNGGFVGISNERPHPRVGANSENVAPNSFRHHTAVARDPESLKDWLIPSIEPRSPAEAQGPSHFQGLAASRHAQGLAYGKPSHMASRQQDPDPFVSHGYVTLPEQKAPMPAFFDLTKEREEARARSSPYLRQDQTSGQGFITLRSRQIPRVPSPELQPGPAPYNTTYRSGQSAAAPYDDGRNPFLASHQPMPLQTSYTQPMPDFIPVSDVFPRRFTPYSEPVFREVRGPGNTRREERVVGVEYVG